MAKKPLLIITTATWATVARVCMPGPGLLRRDIDVALQHLAFLPAGVEMDGLILKLVLRLRPDLSSAQAHRAKPAFSSHVMAAWSLIDVVSSLSWPSDAPDKPLVYERVSITHSARRVVVNIQGATNARGDANSDEMPLAMCRAFLGYVIGAHYRSHALRAGDPALVEAQARAEIDKQDLFD